MNENKGKQSLVEAIETIRKKEALDECLENLKQKAEQRRNRDDYLWYELVLSLGTWGDSEGGVIATDEERYQRVQYDEVREMDEKERIELFEKEFSEVTNRYLNRKPEYLNENLKKIRDMGGLDTAQREFERADGREAKRDFLEQFLGISDKYSRNIGMDLYHPDFRDVIALDSRIQGISEELGLQFDEYEQGEEFYLSVADEVGLNGWELDRVLYNYRDSIKTEL